MLSWHDVYVHDNSFKLGINSAMIRMIPKKERLVHDANVLQQPLELHVQVSCLAIDGTNKFWIICAVNKGMQSYCKSHLDSLIYVLNTKRWKHQAWIQQTLNTGNDPKP
jgi:hypothetical protein